MSNFNFDEQALRRAIQPGLDDLQNQVNETLRATLREIRDEMTGQPADDIAPVIEQRLQERIPLELNLDHAQIREFAEAIQDGTLED